MCASAAPTPPPRRRLDEREKRKQFVKDYGLLDYKALQNREKRKPRDERELIAKLRIFARFQTPEEHEQFVQVSKQGSSGHPPSRAHLPPRLSVTARHQCLTCE
jgi:hypothetical protein